jgi:type VI secretion system protein ImpF
MPELTQKERLQPSLLDRLSDDAPNETQEPREKRVFSLHRLREVVLRDLTWLLNTTNLAAGQDLDDYPQVRRSVLNYGLPDLAGLTVSGIDVLELERALRQAIVEFEPRILRNSLRVRLVVDADQMSHNAMTFDIEGELWAQPMPLHLYLKTEVDLEVGEVRVAEHTGAGGG